MVEETTPGDMNNYKIETGELHFQKQINIKSSTYDNAALLQNALSNSHNNKK
jgi:hypothetical protein